MTLARRRSTPADASNDEDARSLSIALLRVCSVAETSVRNFAAFDRQRRACLPVRPLLGSTPSTGAPQT
jgi:hypothetical protein